MPDTTLGISKNGVALYDYDGTQWGYDARLTLYQFDLSTSALPAPSWLNQTPIAVGVGSYNGIAKSWNVSISTPSVSGFYVLRAQALDFSREALWFNPTDWKGYSDTGGQITMTFNAGNLRDAYSGLVESRPSFDAPPAVPEADRYGLALWVLALLVIALRATRAKQPHKTH